MENGQLPLIVVTILLSELFKLFNVKKGKLIFILIAWLCKITFFVAESYLVFGTSTQTYHFQFLNNITRIFIHFFIHTYFYICF